MTKIILGKNKSKRIEAGHPWVYDNEVEKTDGKPEAGEIVEVFTYDKKFIGQGYFNSNSQILVRLLTRKKEETINEDFFRRRITDAWNYRKKIGYIENCRLVFGEADFLPALVIDKFGDYFVLQTIALGMDKWKEIIVKILNEIFAPKGIYERNDVPVRLLEGLQEQKGFLSTPFSTKITIEENGLKFLVDVENGQKTGFFLDQKENRLALKNIVKDAEVLDCFCHTGSFSLYASHFGAKNVIGLDASEEAVKMAKENALLNGLEYNCNFQSDNAFDFLNQAIRDKKKFDVIILDPPAFTKSRATLQNAIRGYKEINLRAMQLLKPHGFLVTCSCSHFIHPKLFKEIIHSAGKDSRKNIREVLYQTQAKDHPVLWSVEETLYLKCFILEII